MSDDVFDLDAAIAEDAREPFPFILGGIHFELPHPEELPWQDATKLTAGKLDDIETIMAGCLGDQWEDFSAQRLGTRGLIKLVNQWMEHAGVTPGESSASTAPSARTARRSTTTSKRSTASRSRKR